MHFTNNLSIVFLHNFWKINRKISSDFYTVLVLLLQNKMLKTYQFKTQCKDDIHSSKTANIILPGLMTEYRWTTLRVQNRIQVQMHPWMLVETTLVTEFECYFACTRKGVHLSLSRVVAKLYLELSYEWRSFKLISFWHLWSIAGVY